MTKTRHHGNLREALITAGLELMETGGPDALSLRKCAALAGVSHAAPAHHFNGLISLKAAIVARGHQMFAATLQTACAHAAADPQSRLIAICHGYITFAKTHSAVFKFMFQPHDVDLSTLDAATQAELTRDSDVSYQMLRDACAPFQPIAGDPLGTETAIWSLVHGYAMLFCGGQSSGPPGNVVPDIAELLPKLVLK